MDGANSEEPAFPASGPGKPGCGSDVGYGRPPEHSKLKPGQTANRRGRPRGARGRKQVVREIAGETHVVVEGGKRQRRTTLDLVLLMLRNRAAEGDVRAFQLYHELHQQYAPQELSDKPRGTVIVPEIATREQWERIIAEHRKERNLPDPPG
jgi:hypothetical protein